jgi:phosphatidylglycerol---prolipoprotein diacylglyceryl transferase
MALILLLFCRHLSKENITCYKINKLVQFPWQIFIGSLPVPVHAIFEAAGFFIGFRYFLYLRRKHHDSINDGNRTWILIGAIFGALIGSRLVGGLENFAQLLQSGNKLLYFYQNKTVIGGFLGGLGGVELTKYFIGEKKASGDLFTYPMILALIIGRIGCFGMGIYEETYGIPTQLPLGMNLGDGIRRHPVALYEIGFLTTLWIILKRIEARQPLVEGAQFKLFMISYLVFRFSLDYIKPHYTFSIGLSTIQVACLAGLLWYYRYIIRPKLFTNAGSI